MSGPQTLAARYAAIVCDLDGVVYRGPTAVPHAIEALTSSNLPVIYATNNASRTPEDVAAHLRDLGLDCEPGDVATSSQAGARLVADNVPPSSRVLAVGGPGVVTASDLAEVAYAVQAGATWVATNTDATLPTNRGVAPGNGSLIGAVQRAVGHAPDMVAGKPSAPLYLMCADRLAIPAERVLAVGDRLDTDIEGAVAAGMDSLLVLTGVDDLAACLEAPPHRRPTWVAPDLRALNVDPDTEGDWLHALSRAVVAVHRARDAGSTASDIAALSESAESVLAAVRFR